MLKCGKRWPTPAEVLANARAWVAFAAVSARWGVPSLLIGAGADGGVTAAFLARTRRRPAARARAPPRERAVGGRSACPSAWRVGWLGTLIGIDVASQPNEPRGALLFVCAVLCHAVSTLLLIRPLVGGESAYRRDNGSPGAAAGPVGSPQPTSAASLRVRCTRSALPDHGSAYGVRLREELGRASARPSAGVHA